MTTESVIYKQSVRQMIVKVNEKNITNEGYFDLQIIPNLRIVNKGLTKELRDKSKITQKEIANLINVPLRTLIGWEHYNKSMPFSKLIELAELLKLPKEELYLLIKNSEFTLGRHHGKNRIKLPLKPEDFNLVRFLVPAKNRSTYLKKDSPQEVKKFVIDNFSIDKQYFNKTGLISIYSLLLNLFLKTFYEYSWNVHLQFPMSEEIRLWSNEEVNLTNAVIIPILLSDGGEKPNNRFFCSGESNIIHSIWTDAWYYSDNILPSSYKIPVKDKTIYVTTHNLKDAVVSKLKTICPRFKTSPYRETKERYLEGEQPSIEYLLKATSLEQQIAIHIWAVTEGSISLHRDGRSGLVTPCFRIACAHPGLVNQLKILTKKQGINMHIRYEKRCWSGINGLSTSSIRSIINFLKMGGFLKGIKISSKSKYYKGLEKQDVLLSILEFMDRQRRSKLLRKINVKQINEHIKKIALNNEFKDNRYYIKRFS